MSENADASAGLRRGPVVFVIALFAVFVLGIGLLLFIERPHNDLYKLYLAEDVLSESTVLTKQDRERVRAAYDSSSFDERKILAVIIHGGTPRSIELFNYIDRPGYIWSFEHPWQLIAAPAGFHVLGKPCMTYLMLTDGQDFTASGSGYCDNYKPTRVDNALEHLQHD